jgi:hypothetical protein
MSLISDVSVIIGFDFVLIVICTWAFNRMKLQEIILSDVDLQPL